MIFFHTHLRPGFVVDIAADMFAIETLSLKSKRAGMLTLGGGVSKHHIANAMYMVRSLLKMNVMLRITSCLLFYSPHA